MRRFTWPLVAFAGATAVGVVVAADVDSPVRPIVVVSFLLACPGLALVRLLGIGDVVVELTLGVALSVALASIVAAGSVYSGAWSPTHGLVILIAITVAAGFVELLGSRRRAARAQERDVHG